MAKRLVAVIAVAAFAMTSGAARPQRSHRVPMVKDDRRKSPGIHRAGPAELAVRNRFAQAESDKLIERARLRAQGLAPKAVSVPATAWVSLGPTDAANEFNGVDIPGVDSGRPNSIIVDPRDANIVYMAASGGGVWKAYDFLSPSGPTWQPLSDLLPNLAAGALAIDTAHPDTLYLGAGDFVDYAGNTIQKTTDGGASWAAPVALPGVRSVRALGVNGQQVLAGTDAGLFGSRDGGKSFAPIDLPNTAGASLIESMWSVVATGGGHWVASGVTSCAAGDAVAPLSGGSDPGPQCAHGNNGEIWHSTDGVSWTLAALPKTTGTGRITLAAGDVSDSRTTVVYAFVGAVDGGSTIAFWRSRDGGATWADATGSLANPTLPLGSNPPDCGSIDVGQGQTWYNEAIVVDPTNPDHVLVGGSLCGMRTLNATSASPTWELIAHWLPGYDGGLTANGRLPYVHADWHTALASTVGGTLLIFAGTDGGIFTSANVFDSVAPSLIIWAHHNRGLVTHLVYALGSGDPATANPFVLFAGLQDNGTRYRASPRAPSIFDQPVGGDGIGATVHVASSGTTYWASVEFAHAFCQPSDTIDCADGNNWNGVDPTLNPDDQLDEDDDDARRPPVGAAARGSGGDSEDAEPFFIHYANVETDTVGQSVLTHSNGQVFVSVVDGSGALAWQPISQDLTPTGNGFSSVTASRTVPGLYGAAGAISAAPFLFTTSGNTQTNWTAAQPVFPTGTTARLTGPSSIDFPPVLPAGTVPGQVFIGAFTNTLNDPARTPPPDDKGRLYRTTDFGQTWTSIVGADPNHRLPNVPIYVVKYDPVTPTTIYAGTDLGIYLSTNDGASWDRMGEGFPIIPVRDIYVARNQDFIRVATYGRGLWEIYPSAAANQGALGNGDYDRNQVIDWVDIAAMSSRLGVTPASTSQPFYSWIMDMTGSDSDPPLQQIDDADLAMLIGRLGGHP